MNNSDKELLEKAKEILRVNTYKDVAIAIGYKESSVINWSNRGLPKMARLKISQMINQTNSTSDNIEIPYYEDVSASMGNGNIIYDSSVRKIMVSASFLREIYGIYNVENLSLINASGDSMYPTIPPESIIIVQEGDVPDGAICAAILDGELYVKRLQKRPKLKLISDNKFYDDIYITETDNFRIIGKVIGIFKKI